MRQYYNFCPQLCYSFSLIAVNNKETRDKDLIDKHCELFFGKNWKESTNNIEFNSLFH